MPINVTHGMSKTRTYIIWQHMKARCLRKTHPRYADWGGRGIKICEHWMVFENFYADMGEAKPGMTIDRIDNNGNYEPLNCKWSTIGEQNKNKRNTRKISANGQTKTINEWCKELGVNRSFICNRLLDGWSESDTINRPKRKTIPKHIKDKTFERICICGKVDKVLMVSKLQGNISKFCTSCRMKNVYKKTNHSKAKIVVRPNSKDKTMDSSFDMESPSPVPE